jgi:hypothetical protein
MGRYLNTAAIASTPVPARGVVATTVTLEAGAFAAQQSMTMMAMAMAVVVISMRTILAKMTIA